jgi:hypothetical protein
MLAVQAAAAQKFRQVSSDCDCFRTARTCTAAPTEAGYASRKRKCPRLEASRAPSHACQASQGSPHPIHAAHTTSLAPARRPLLHTTVYELGMNGSGTLHLKEKVQVY